MAYNIFEKWPFTSYQNLNLSWILQGMQQLAKAVENVSGSIQGAINAARSAQSSATAAAASAAAAQQDAAQAQQTAAGAQQTAQEAQQDAAQAQQTAAQVQTAVSGKADKALRVAMASTDTTPTLDPNKLYVFPEMASLTPTLNTPSDATIVNEYHFIFDSGATATVLTLPATVLQPDGFTVEANMHYEVSILEGAMTAQGWAVAST